MKLVIEKIREIATGAVSVYEDNKLKGIVGPVVIFLRYLRTV